MSQEIDRNEMIRSTVITVVLAAVLLSLGLLFWAWSSPDVVDSTFVGTLNDINPFLVTVIEIALMFGFYVFLTVTLVNLRLFITKIRAGWLEILVPLILVTVISYFMFQEYVAAATFVLSLGFVVYLYLLQE
ncbi:MAG: hypothetical protein ACOC38_12980 [Promethearchaeia archaeon]